jgi:AMMECR1 domain-containing protein
MPQLTVELTWQEWETLETVAQSEEIPPAEVVRRALDVYLAQERIQQTQQADSTVTATRDHLIGPNEVMDLDL